MNILKDIVAGVMGLAAHVKDTSADLARIEASMYYIKAVQVTRRIVLGLIALFFFVVMMGAAVVMIHVLVLFFIPMESAARLTAAVILCLIDAGFVGAVIALAASERLWMKLTKSDKIARSAIQGTDAPRITETPSV